MDSNTWWLCLTSCLIEVLEALVLIPKLSQRVLETLVLIQLGRFKVNTFSNFKNSGIEVNVFNAIFYWIQGFQCHFCRKNVIFKDFQNLVSFDFPHFHIFCRISSPEFTKTRIGNTPGLVFEKMDAKVSKYWKHWIQYLVNPKVLKFWKHWIQYQILILKLLISRVSIVSQMEITQQLACSCYSKDEMLLADQLKAKSKPTIHCERKNGFWTLFRQRKRTPTVKSK